MRILKSFVVSTGNGETDGEAIEREKGTLGLKMPDFARVCMGEPEEEKEQDRRQQQERVTRKETQRRESGQSQRSGRNHRRRRWHRRSGLHVVDGLRMERRKRNGEERIIRTRYGGRGRSASRREGKHSFIEDNMARYDELARKDIETAKPFLICRIAEENTRVRPRSELMRDWRRVVGRILVR